MCGIFGMIGQKGKRPEAALVRKATDALRHRGPDDAGYFFAENIALGSRRLAILDLSPQGHQPMTGWECTLSYNGEIYNYKELRSQLEAEGYTFQSETDTEVVLAAYDFWGRDCVQYFNGMWAFALYDPKRQTLFFSRDRYGIKPFYYTEMDGFFCWASEIKAFTTLPFWKARLQADLAADFAILGLQHHKKETLFAGVYQLLPGQHLIYDLVQECFEVQTYYSVDQISENKEISFQESTEIFRERLTSAVQLHSRADVKVGSALSGGLDSSAIVALQYRQRQALVSPAALETVSYCPVGTPFDESPYLDVLLQQYPIKVHKINPSFATLMQDHDAGILAQDEPLLSGSLLAQYHVFREARSAGITVMLDGQGADEILAGYGTYYLPFLKQLFANQPFKLPRELFGLALHHRSFWAKLGKLSKKKVNYQDFFLVAPTPSVPLKSGFRPYANHMLSQGILPALLQFEDRNSMAHSVESRVPFLDHRLVDFTMSLPAGFKIRGGIRKALLRAAVSDILPKKIAKRYDKIGFKPPQHDWMLKETSFILASIRKSVALHPSVFHPSLIAFSEVVLRKGQQEHFDFLWRVMSLGRWMELFSV